MSVMSYIPKGYENLGVCRLTKNKANQSQFEAKANVKMDKHYRRTKTPDGGNRTPISAMRPRRVTDHLD